MRVFLSYTRVGPWPRLVPRRSSVSLAGHPAGQPASMRVLLLSSLTAATGNEATTRRIASLLRESGASVRVEDCNRVRRGEGEPAREEVRGGA